LKPGGVRSLPLVERALQAAVAALPLFGPAAAQEPAAVDARAGLEPAADKAALQELLARSDIAAAAPPSFRTEMRLTASGRPEPAEIEVWRAGGRTLVRFLGAAQRGKYLLYAEPALWFIAPGAKKPVKLPRSFRLQGSATLDDILGLRYSRDYEVARAEPDRDALGPLLRLHLVGVAPGLPYPEARYVVREEQGRPLSIELRVKSGKPATSIEFVEWFPGPRLRPRLFVLTDRLRGGTTRVEVLSFEERSVPKGLFDLASAAERRKLEEQGALERP
jgi:hypothetical protein